MRSGRVEQIGKLPVVGPGLHAMAAIFFMQFEFRRELGVEFGRRDLQPRGGRRQLRLARKPRDFQPCVAAELPIVAQLIGSQKRDANARRRPPQTAALAIRRRGRGLLLEVGQRFDRGRQAAEPGQSIAELGPMFQAAVQFQLVRRDLETSIVQRKLRGSIGNSLGRRCRRPALRRRESSTLLICRFRSGRAAKLPAPSS